MADIRIIGNTSGINSGFLQGLTQAARAAGVTKMTIESGKRSDAAHPGGPTNTGVPHSNHLTGLAVDGTAYIPGRGTIPLGDLPTLGQYGIRSGDAPGFYNGQPDPHHVDAGYEATGYDPRGPQTASYQTQTQQSSFSSSMFTPGQVIFINRYAQQTGLDPRVVAAEVYNESNINTSGPGGALARQAAGDHDWLNIGRTDTGPRGAGYAAWRDPITAADASAAWVKGQLSIPGFGRASSGIQGIPGYANQSPAAQIQAIQRSGWASSGYPNLPSVYRTVTGGAPAGTTTGNVSASPPTTGVGAFGRNALQAPPRIVGVPTPGAATPAPDFKQVISQVLRHAAAIRPGPVKFAQPPTPAANLFRPLQLQPSDYTPVGNYDWYQTTQALR